MPDACIGYALAASGQPGEARRLLDLLDQISRTRYVAAYHRAIIHVGLGERDRAFEWLSRADEERHPWLVLLNVEPLLDPLRSDPRFADLVARIGLAPTR